MAGAAGSRVVSPARAERLGLMWEWDVVPSLPATGPSGDCALLPWALHRPSSAFRMLVEGGPSPLSAALLEGASGRPA